MVELDYAFNAYLGCAHGCRYCYAADITPGESPETWGDTVRVRTNIIEVLQREIKSKRRGLVGISTITDPYQPIEAKYRLSRQAIGLLLANGFRVSIQTKSPLVLRDLDILRDKKGLDAGISLATPDKEISRLIDRKSPLPDARIRTLRELSRNMIKTWMFLGPIIPGINDSDESFEALISMASDLKIRVVLPPVVTLIIDLDFSIRSPCIPCAAWKPCFSPFKLPVSRRHYSHEEISTCFSHENLKLVD